MPLETVLLAIGTEDAERTDALSAAVADVAGPADSRVVVLHAFGPAEYEDAVEHLDFDSVTDAEPDVVARRHQSVRDVVDRLDEAGIEAEIEGAVGDVGVEIVEAAQRCDADQLFVGGRSRSPAGKAVFGSTAQYVMLNAPCPVTFVRTG